MKLSLDHGTYVKSVGFVEKNGQRVQKRWFLGQDEAEAIVLAAKLKKAWKESANVQMFKGQQVWADDFSLDLVDEQPDQTRERLESNGKLTSTPDTAEDITLRQALNWFYGEKESRKTLRNRSNIKQSTVTRLRYNLEACLLPFPNVTFLHQLNSETCRTIHNYWMGTNHANRPGARKATMGERTAINYLATLKTFLRAVATNNDFGFDLPKELGAWRFTLKRAEVTTPTMEELATIYKAASPRLKCFILIALNAGQTQGDIGRMTQDDIIIDNGHSVLRKVRLKTGDKVTYKGSWQLWKETVAAINEQKATGGTLLFVNKDGKRLYEQREKSKSDAIGDEFRKLTDRLLKEGSKLRKDEHGNALVTFSTIRAWGATWIINKTQNEYYSKLYLCHAVATGATQHYIDAQYAPLQPMLKDMRTALKFISGK